jgi:hypothetical protein
MSNTFGVLTTCPDYRDMCGRIVHEFSSKQVKYWSFKDWESVNWQTVKKGHENFLLVISCLSDLPTKPLSKPSHIGNIIRRHLVFTNDLPTEALPSRLARLDIRDPSRLHIADLNIKNVDAKTIEGIIRRAISGLASSDDDRIVDAWWESDDFVILSPSFERLYVPLAKLATFIGKDRASIQKYEVDPDGSFVYWPHSDVHLGWMQFLHLVNPSAAVHSLKMQEEFNREYGVAIKNLRVEQGLRQSDIPGLTPRQLGRIEKGQCHATRNALTKLANAHHMELNEYLGQLADRTEAAAGQSKIA